MNLEEYLNNKRVIIIGPSESLLKNKNKEFIDSFDIVVRVNRGIEPTDKYYDYIGERTDILYNCMLELPDNGGVIDVDYFQKKKLKYVIYHPKVSYSGVAKNKKPKRFNKETLEKLHKKNIKTKMIDYNFYNSISSNVNCRPNTGYIAIFHLLSYNLKELYITGYSFYLDNFMPGYKDHVEKNEWTKKCFKSQRHNQLNLWNFLKKEYEKNKKIKVDKYLDRILKLNNLTNDEDTLKYVFH